MTGDKGLLILMRSADSDACWGIEPSIVGRNLGFLRIIIRYALEVIKFIPPASVGTVSTGRFSGNDIRSSGVL